jgi:hypothetical protein
MTVRLKRPPRFNLSVTVLMDPHFPEIRPRVIRNFAAFPQMYDGNSDTKKRADKFAFLSEQPAMLAFLSEPRDTFDPHFCLVVHRFYDRADV